MISSPVESASLKGNTLSHLLKVGIPDGTAARVPANQTIRTKLEIDRDPPGGFATESRYLLLPVPFAVRVCALPDLFAGKIHALLFRRWKSRVKGRDWYDFVWFVTRHPQLHISHLEERMRQSGHLRGRQALGPEGLARMLEDAITRLDVRQAQQEVRAFLKHPESVDAWSPEFFRDLADRIQYAS